MAENPKPSQTSSASGERIEAATRLAEEAITEAARGNAAYKLWSCVADAALSAPLRMGAYATREGWALEAAAFRSEAAQVSKVKGRIEAFVVVRDGDNTFYTEIAP